MPSAQQLDANDPNTHANSGRLELTQYLDNLAYQKTAARRITISGIKTRVQAEVRQAQVRTKILALIGGLPERTPLNARTVGSVEGNGFHVDKVIFDSQPNFPVTALLYLPNISAGSKLHDLPAIVVTPGHAPQGKALDYVLSSTLARNGFAVLDYDPIGQGERLQYLEGAAAHPYLNAPTAQHGEAGLQPTLIGDAVARYFIWDGMRAIDYLESLPNIDPNRIGAFGCSGGGTITAMLGALDSRLKAIGVACFWTNFDTLLPAIGPQDAEQSIPDFISNGLDFPDWAELAAPRSYAIIATYGDMFPFAGAQQTEDEVRRFYQLFGAGAHLEFITGPGPHGDILPEVPDIMSFFLKSLQPSADDVRPILPLPGNGLWNIPTGELPKGLYQNAQGMWFVPPSSFPGDFFQDTPTGQVATSYPGVETVHSLNLKRAARIGTNNRTSRSMSLSVLREDIRDVTRADVLPCEHGQPCRSGFEKVSEEDLSASLGATKGIYVHHITIHIEQGIDLQGEIAAPRSTTRSPAILILTNAASMPPANPDYTALIEQVKKLAEAGNVVLSLTPRPSPPGTERTASPLLGDFYQTELRAELTGKTIMGMRISDVIRAINYLSTRHDVDANRISAYASYHLGLVLINAAILDSRLSHITVDHVLTSYRSLLEAPVPIHASEDILPGVLRRYDIPELVSSLGPRLTLTSPLSGREDLSDDRFIASDR